MDPVERLLRSRGLTPDRMRPAEGLLLPPSGSPHDIERYLEILGHYAARLLLREVIKGSGEKGRGAVERFCPGEVLDGYLEALRQLGVIVGDPARPWKAVSDFGPTYEWACARMLERAFGVEAAWGVKVSGEGSGGDHDVVADLGGRFLYLEVKTAPPRHVDAPEVGAFVRRVADLSPDLAVLHDDTHLRMKDKLVPLMEEALGAVTGGREPMERLERETFHWNGRVFVTNSKPSLGQNLSLIFRTHFKFTIQAIKK